MSSLEGVKAGDELLLMSSYGGAQVYEREPKIVRVHKVGRTLVHLLVYEGSPDGPTETYRIEDGVRNDNYRHSVLKTREDWEGEKMRHELDEALRAHGVETSRRGPKSIVVLEELLAVLEKHEGKKD